MRIVEAKGAIARRQATWIAGMEPWRGLGYTAAGLARWLARMGRERRVRVALEGLRARPRVLGIIVVQPEVLLGDFVALVAVRPELAGQGVGQALMAHVEKRAFRQRRWLYVSSDAANQGAARFYRKLGFRRAARLSDLVRPGRSEILWRKAAHGPG